MGINIFIFLHQKMILVLLQIMFLNLHFNMDYFSFNMDFASGSGQFKIDFLCLSHQILIETYKTLILLLQKYKSKKQFLEVRFIFLLKLTY